MLQYLRPDGTLTHPLNEIQNLVPLNADGYQTIYRKMCATRAFYDYCESVGVKRKDHMRLHIGPRGQEAAEVASTLALDPHDWILYYARSYGTVLARGISFRSLFDSFYYYGAPPESVTDDFLEHHIILPYTWVGMHIPHAVGVAWAEKLQKLNAIAVAYFGDGATAEADFHGAMEWASVFEIPVVFICENNQYAISTPAHMQNPSPTFAAKASAYNMASNLVDGNDALAMYATMAHARYYAHKKQRPIFIEAVTYRDGPHTSAVGEIIPIPTEEKQYAREIDPLKRLKLFRLSDPGATLFEEAWSEEQEAALFTELSNELHTIGDKAHEEYNRVYEQYRTECATSLPASYHATPKRRIFPVSKEMFVPEIIPQTDCRDAVNFGLYDALTNDANKRIVCIGQDIGRAGGVLRTTALPRDFVREYIPAMKNNVVLMYVPLVHFFPDRIFDAPLNEPAIAAVALGISMAGMRPIFEMQFSGFVQSALHHIQEFGLISQRHRNLLRAPGVCRLPFGHGDRIEYHNTCEIGMFTRFHNIVIACPSIPQDFYDMIFAASQSDLCVAFFEHLDLYRMIPLRQDIKRRLPTRAIEDFGIRIARIGGDITIASYGRMLHECYAAAEKLALAGISAEVLDLRIITPLDTKTLLDSVKKTGRFLVVQEECVHGFGAYLVSLVANEALEYIRAPQIPVLSTPCSFAPPPRFWEFHVPTRSLIIERTKKLIKEE